MNDIREHDIVVLRRPEPDYGLASGDVGTVVHLYGDGAAFEVEFIAGEGQTVAVLTLGRDDVRVMQSGEILHVRELAA